MNRQEKNELYELIKEAVKDGFKEALEETGIAKGEPYPDSERPNTTSGIEIPKLKTPEGDAFEVFGETPNAKAFLTWLAGKLNSAVPITDSSLRSLYREMCDILSDDERKFVLTHIESSIPKSDRCPLFQFILDDFMKIVLEG